ncbi:hypothetical protein [Lacrimispora xylanisolvens]|uniref:hypothetical protein n=1 Tax=Lacrimispora xylanisolvens TaxID=384636 RepID=UPI002402CEE3
MSKDGKIANFGGIEMTQRAKLHTTIFHGNLGDKIHREYSKQRNNLLLSERKYGI